MEAGMATPVRRLSDSSTSPAPSPLSLRQWRPMAQRNLRNQWSRLLTAKARWVSAVADGRSHASLLVNAHLSRSYMPGMDLGVLKDMPGIRDRASTKLAQKEVQCREMLLLLLAYKEMVLAVSDLAKASRSMRCFSKAFSSSPLFQFTDCQDDLNDSGDGGGAPVYKWVSILEFDPSLEWSDELYDGEMYEFQSIGLQSEDSCPLPENRRADVLKASLPGHTPSHEVLQN